MCGNSGLISITIYVNFPPPPLFPFKCLPKYFICKNKSSYAYITLLSLPSIMQERRHDTGLIKVLNYQGPKNNTS